MYFAGLQDAVWEALSEVNRHRDVHLRAEDADYALEDYRAQLRHTAIVIATEPTDARQNLMLGQAMEHKVPVVLMSHAPGNVPFFLRDLPVALLSKSSSTSYTAPGLAQLITDTLSGTLVPKPVFVGYSHKDAAYLERVHVHLAPLRRMNLIEPWSDKAIKAGDDWQDAIRGALARVQVAVLLISADFLASDFIATNELPPLLQAAKDRGVLILPVIVKPSRFLRDSALSRFQAVNDPTRPLSGLSEHEREMVFADLAARIEAATEFQSPTPRKS